MELCTVCTLYFQVISGNGLLAMDGNGLSDPYCMVKLGSVSHRTSTMKETLSPVWNEVFLLHSEEVHKAEGIIKFQLWDADDWSKDDFLGQVSVITVCFSGCIISYYSTLY